MNKNFQIPMGMAIGSGVTYSYLLVGHDEIKRYILTVVETVGAILPGFFAPMF